MVVIHIYSGTRRALPVGAIIWICFCLRTPNSELMTVFFLRTSPGVLFLLLLQP